MRTQTPSASPWVPSEQAFAEHAFAGHTCEESTRTDLAIQKKVGTGSRAAVLYLAPYPTPARASGPLLPSTGLR